MDNPNQASFSEQNSMLIRWRGKQEGPYTSAIIETKLAANQIGLLHEVFHNGNWITLRDYFVERDTSLRAARQAIEEHNRELREQADRRLKGMETQRQTELLAEERRKAAQLEVAQAQEHFGSNIPVSPLQSPPKKRGSSGAQIFGILLLIAGLVVTGYYFLGFDPTVESGVGRVNNLGLMADRQNGIIIGIGLALIGTIMLVIGSRKES